MVSYTDINSFLRIYNNYDIQVASISLDCATNKCYHHLESIMSMGTIIVAHDNDCIVGTGTAIIEPKLIRAGQCVGHIEDIVVHPDWRGQNIAATILHMLKEYAVSKNCYKVILDCNPEVQCLYAKCGFHVSGIQMKKLFSVRRVPEA
jgi:glucosamine-phosphate N-acetyltransferase